MHLWEQARNLHCQASPRQVTINSTRARHYRLSHAGLSVMLQITYTELEQTYNHRGDRKGLQWKKLAAWLNDYFPSKCQEVKSERRPNHGLRLAVVKTWNQELGLQVIGGEITGSDTRRPEWRGSTAQATSAEVACDQRCCGWSFQRDSSSSVVLY